MAAGVRAMSSQRDSIAASFSWRLMSLRGRLKDMRSVYLSAEPIQIHEISRLAFYVSPFTPHSYLPTGTFSVRLTISMGWGLDLVLCMPAI